MKDNSSYHRFHEMSELHTKYFFKYRSSLINAARHLGTEEETFLNSFVITKIGSKKGVRAYLLAKMLEIVGEKPHEYTGLLAAVELHLASMYCFNVAVDNKAGYTRNKDKSVCYKVRDIVFETSLQVIEELTISQKARERIKKIFHLTNDVFYKGQTLEIFANTYPDYDNVRATIKKLESVSIASEFGIADALSRKTLINCSQLSLEERVYLRTFGINAGMIENLGRIVGSIRNLSQHYVDQLARYGMYYGMAMQITNDIQDFSLDLVEEDEPTREKIKSDVFSDLKDFRISYPVFYYMTVGDLEKIPFGPRSYDEYEKFRGILCTDFNIMEKSFKNGIFFGSIFKRCVCEALAYSKLAIKSLSVFPDCESKKALIESAVSMATTSKYIKKLKEKYGVKQIPQRTFVNQRLQNLTNKEVLLDRIRF